MGLNKREQSLTPAPNCFAKIRFKKFSCAHALGNQSPALCRLHSRGIHGVLVAIFVPTTNINSECFSAQINIIQGSEVIKIMATASSIASTSIVLEALRKDNYKNWSALVENYLVGQGLWHGIVEADPNKLESEKDEDWRCKNAKALHAIQLTCGSEILSNIRTFKKAREAWNHLKVSFSEDVKAYPDIEQGRDDHSIHQLHSAVKRGYWNDAKSYIRSSPNSIFSTTSSMGRTVLHVAVASGDHGIVKELVSMANRRLLKMQDKRGYTALALAAELTDNKDMAEWMVKKGGEELVTVKTKQDGSSGGEIPVLIASAKGHKEMTRYLFSKTPYSVFVENEGCYGLMLLTRCILAEIYDVAASLIQNRRSRELPLVVPKKGELPVVDGSESYDLRPIHALAHMASAFRSGTQLGWWRQFIYDSLRPQAHVGLYNIEIILDVEPEEEADTNHCLANMFATHPSDRIVRGVSVSVPIKYLCRYFGQFRQAVQSSILQKITGSEIHEMKKNHYLVLEILKWLSKRVSKSNEAELHNCSAYDSMVQAAKCGIIEFIDSMRHANPDLLWAMDKNKRGIFSHAILNRQEKVFGLIHEMEGRKELIASRKDVFGNNMLHLAAEAGPSSYLSSISNSALQMQRELQWFNAVKSIVPPKCEEAKNKDGKKPCELFTKTHEELMKAGEKWAKDTASSFTLVGTLIITIMFAVAFTVPGGNNQNNGIPIFLGKHAFTVFILADTISLVASSSSVLIFIGILTSRYAEKDFLRSLPLKLLFGLITLFFSVASMMLAFVAALSMMMEGYRGVVIAAMSLAIIPVLVLIPTLLSLSFEILKSTWGPDLLASRKQKRKLICYI